MAVKHTKYIHLLINQLQFHGQEPICVKAIFELLGHMYPCFQNSEMFSRQLHAESQ